MVDESRVGRFLQLYNRLDAELRKRLGADEKRSHASLLEAIAAQDSLFQEYHSRLQAYRALRNSLVHVSWEGNSLEPIAEPGHEVLENYRMLVEYVLQPPSALETIATREIYTVGWSSKLTDGLSFIDSRGFETIPVIDDGVLVGVYTQGTLQRWLLDVFGQEKSLELSAAAEFGVLRKEIGFRPDDATNKGDRPRLVELAPASISVEAIELHFREAALRQRFLVCVCLTESGTAFSPLLGLVTAHNLPSANAHARRAHGMRIQKK